MEEGVLWRRVCYCPGILTQCYLDQKHLVRSTFHVSLSFPEADFGVTGLDSGDPSECPWLPGGGGLHPADVFWGFEDPFALDEEGAEGLRTAAAYSLHFG